MYTRALFVPLTEFAAEMDLCHEAVRRCAGRARIPLFRLPGVPDALLRQTDAAHLQVLLGCPGPPSDATGEGERAPAGDC